MTCWIKTSGQYSVISKILVFLKHATFQSHNLLNDIFLAWCLTTLLASILFFIYYSDLINFINFIFVSFCVMLLCDEYYDKEVQFQFATSNYFRTDCDTSLQPTVIMLQFQVFHVLCTLFLSHATALPIASYTN